MNGLVMTRTGKTWKTFILLAVLDATGCGSQEDPDADGGQADQPAASERQDARLDANAPGMALDSGILGMDSAYAEMETRLDSLWGDSLSVRPTLRSGYRRTLEKARTVRDNTKMRLQELRVSPQGVTPRIREEMRERTRMSLDSLKQLLLYADSARGDSRGGGRASPGS